MGSIKDKILSNIRHYRELPSDFIDISKLIHIRKLLATYGVNLAVEVGLARKAWKIAEYEKEVTRNQKKINFYSKNSNLGKSDLYAKANTGDLQKKAVEAENLFFELDYIFKASREVLGELNQHISYLRGELKQEQFYTREG